MKMLFISFLLILIFYTTSAQVKIGYFEENAEVELLQTDQQVGQQYYKSYSFTMKKGDGAVFTMTCDVFEPHIILATNNSDIIAEAKDRGEASEAKLIFIAPADTSFNVVFTSVQDKKTGKFNINFKMLEASQMIFNDNYSICDRFAFLINHWQLQWELMPGKISNTSDAQTKRWFPNLFFNTTNTLQKGDKAEVKTRYTELLINKENDEANEAEHLYYQLGGLLGSCLDTAQWKIQMKLAEVDVTNPLMELERIFFNMKGGEKGEEQKSIEIRLTKPRYKKPDRYSKVELFFY